MPVIKRYPNRKLYDTEAKKYITLDGIAALIREGQEVQVIDHTTGEDLTALTLSQIIFEQEKKGGGFLPKSVLTSLVQAGGDTVNTLRRGLTAPLDLFRQVDDEIERRLQTLINRGELAKEEGLRLRNKLLNRESAVEEEIEHALAARGVPQKEEIQRLNQQIETLTTKLDALLSDEAEE
jgi:polyhydroxyalkanoate synthesis repressor PhaR